MAHNYTRLHYHLVWGTKHREPLITPAIERRLLGYLRKKCVMLGVHVHAIGCMPDHIHVVCSIPPSLALSTCIAELKGASSHFINDDVLNAKVFYWQSGFGALTVSAGHLTKAVAYANNQKEHHAAGKIRAALEDIGTDDEAAPG